MSIFFIEVNTAVEIKKPSASIKKNLPPVSKMSDTKKKAIETEDSTLIPRKRNMLDASITKTETMFMWRSDSSSF